MTTVLSMCLQQLVLFNFSSLKKNCPRDLLPCTFRRYKTTHCSFHLLSIYSFPLSLSLFICHDHLLSPTSRKKEFSPPLNIFRNMFFWEMSGEVQKYVEWTSCTLHIPNAQRISSICMLLYNHPKLGGRGGDFISRVPVMDSQKRSP